MLSDLAINALSSDWRHSLKSIKLPDDHGSHPRQPTDSWQFKVLIHDPEGRDFGLQLSFLRVSFHKPQFIRSSAWASQQMSQAAFSLTDVNEGEYVSAERFSRVALEISDFDIEPIRGWVDNWQFHYLYNDGPEGGAFNISGVYHQIEFDLSFTGIFLPSMKTDGNSSKGATSLFRSYLYNSLPVSGTLSIDGVKSRVVGTGWLDHGWGRLPLPIGQVVWDRLWFQLNEDAVVLLNRHRRGELNKFYSTAIVLSKVDGVMTIDPEKTEVSILKTWISDVTGTTYPVRWRIKIPDRSLDVEVNGSPVDQESRQAIPAWKGVVMVNNTRGEKKRIGHGFAELYGY